VSYEQKRSVNNTCTGGCSGGLILLGHKCACVVNPSHGTTYPAFHAMNIRYGETQQILTETIKRYHHHLNEERKLGTFGHQNHNKWLQRNQWSDICMGIPCLYESQVHGNL